MDKLIETHFYWNRIKEKYGKNEKEDCPLPENFAPHHTIKEMYKNYFIGNRIVADQPYLIKRMLYRAAALAFIKRCFLIVHQNMSDRDDYDEPGMADESIESFEFYLKFLPFTNSFKHLFEPLTNDSY